MARLESTFCRIFSAPVHSALATYEESFCEGRPEPRYGLELFDPERWTAIDRFDFADITYHRSTDTGAVRIAFDRPEKRNAFRPGDG